MSGSKSSDDASLSLDALSIEYDHLLNDAVSPGDTIKLNQPKVINAFYELLKLAYETAMLTAKDENTIKAIMLKSAIRM